MKPYTLVADTRLASLYDLATQVCRSGVPGNFVECGTYRGGTSALLAQVLRQQGKGRKLFAFDTFEGMPKSTDFDKHNNMSAERTGCVPGKWKSSLGNFNALLRHFKVSNLVVPTKGLFRDTLPKMKATIGPIAFLHADADFYESTLDIFNNLYAKIVPGGIIQVDDYGWWDGCRKAIHEFEEARGVEFKLQRIDETGVWFAKQ